MSDVVEIDEVKLLIVTLRGSMKGFKSQVESIDWTDEAVNKTTLSCISSR